MKLFTGDCLGVLKTMPDNSFDSIVTDPPYGLSFMGKKWDYDVPSEEIWRECLRVLKPGGHLLAFAGTRTQHRMAVRIEDAGFEIRDMIAWIYGSGFPKSADISKMLDKQEQKQWHDVSKAVDNLPEFPILQAWKEYSKNVLDAGILFQRNETGTGMNTPENDSVPANVVLKANPKNNDAVVLVAELSLIEAHRTREVNFSSAQFTAGNNTMELSAHATSVGKSSASLEAMLTMPDFSVLQSVWGCQDVNTTDKLKAAEVLKIWLGNKPSLRMADTNALCAALTDDLKRIILSQSKTFQSLDTTRRMECVSAISVTITESTAASLISFTADILKSKAIDKEAGAERAVLGDNPNWRPAKTKGGAGFHKLGKGEADIKITAPATDDAKKWNGWGTALKPALEPITVARKPLSEKTVAANVLKWGTGAINIDGGRVNANGESLARPFGSGGISAAQLNKIPHGTITGEDKTGRWPANLIHDGSDEVLELFPETKSGTRNSGMRLGMGYHGGNGGKAEQFAGDSGSAARFFYCAKASKRDRNDGCKEVTTWENVELKENLIGVASLAKDISEDIMLYLEDSGCYMILFGNNTTVQFQRDLMFTIKTVINLITVLRTLNYSQLSTIKENILDAIKIIQENGSSLAESVESINQYQNTTNEKTALVRGVVLAVCKMLLKIKEKGKSGNIHNTVKPTDLMRYLVRLVTPPGGVVLDPFMGSGSTGKAARLEGFRFIGIEREAEYVEIAKARIGGAE